MISGGERRRWSIGWQLSLARYGLNFFKWFRDGIFGHQFDKRLETFAPCYTQSFYWWIFLRKPGGTYSGFKKCIQKNLRTRKIESFRGEHFVESKDEGRKPDNNSSLRRLEFMPKNLDNKCRSRIPSLLYFFFLFSAGF